MGSLLPPVVFTENRAVNILPSYSTQDQVVFSDASDWGLGVVFVKERTIMVYSRCWSETERAQYIGEREALALSEAIDLCPVVRFNEPTFFVDATALYHSMSRGLSRNFVINSVVSKMKKRYKMAQVFWVSSEANVADDPSRGKMCNVTPFRLLDDDGYCV